MGSQESMKVPIWIIIGFQLQDSQDTQNVNNDTFCKLPVVSAPAVIGTEKCPGAGILLTYDDDEYSQGYAQIEQGFRALTKDDILQAFISNHDFRSSNVRAHDVRYTIYVFDKNGKNKTSQLPNQIK